MTTKPFNNTKTFQIIFELKYAFFYKGKGWVVSSSDLGTGLKCFRCLS